MGENACSNKWPVADFTRCTSLQGHLEGVTAFSHRVFSDRLALRSFRVAGFKPEAALAIAAGLHDIAKASLYYRGKGNFALHEHASAALLYEASRDCRSYSSHLTLILASKAIARHHSAMEGRRPKDVVREGRSGEVLEALSRLRKDYVGKALSWSRELRDLALAALNSLQTSASPERLRNVLNHLGGLGNIPGVERGLEARVLWAVTGYLIVSDILVAALERGEEGREDTDKLAAYARYWLSELGFDSLSDVGRAVSEARADGRYRSLIAETLEDCL